MEKVYMQITSGRGPAECCRVVALVLEKILKQAVAKARTASITNGKTGLSVCRPSRSLIAKRLQKLKSVMKLCGHRDRNPVKVIQEPLI